MWSNSLICGPPLKARPASTGRADEACACAEKGERVRLRLIPPGLKVSCVSDRANRSTDRSVDWARLPLQTVRVLIVSNDSTALSLLLALLLSPTERRWWKRAALIKRDKTAGLARIGCQSPPFLVSSCAKGETNGSGQGGSPEEFVWNVTARAVGGSSRVVCSPKSLSSISPLK